MPHFADECQTKTIRADWWGENESVTIRKIPYGASEKMEADATSIENLPDGERLVKLNLATLRLLRTHAGIVEWTFGPPVTLKNVERLLPEDGEFIYSEIMAFNGRRSAEEQEAFPGGTGDPAEGGQAAGADA